MDREKEKEGGGERENSKYKFSFLTSSNIVCDIEKHMNANNVC